MSKKSKIKLISSLITLCLTFSMFIFSTVTFAWLSANRRAEADQVEMQVDTYSNLVISNNNSDITAADYTQMVVTYTTNDTKYAPCTHDSDSGFSTEYLKYVTNLTEIDRATGYKKTDGALESSTSGTAYVNTATLDLSKVTINVLFEAIDQPTT